MKSINFQKEWDFIISETHNEKLNSKNLIKREILFVLQILLNKCELNNYSTLKKIYCKK